MRMKVKTVMILTGTTINHLISLKNSVLNVLLLNNQLMQHTTNNQNGDNGQQIFFFQNWSTQHSITVVHLEHLLTEYIVQAY